jgi:hypothetical protein
VALDPLGDHGGRRQAGECRRGRDRRLDEEDRLPVERAGQGAAQRGAQRGREHRGPHPEAPPVVLDAVQQREGGHEARRAAERLDGAGDEHSREVIGLRAGQAGESEEREAGRPDHADAQRACRAFQRQQRAGQHRGVDPEDRGDALDVRVEVVEELRKGQRDDRGVGQDQARRDGEQQRPGAHGGDSVAGSARTWRDGS